MRRYLKPNYNVCYYENIFHNIIISDMSVRDKVVEVAMFFINIFPKLPYFWGGGHDVLNISYFKHLDSEWGIPTPILFDGSSEQQLNNLFPKSLDCSGFVMMCLVAGGYDIFPYLNNKNCLDSGDFLKLGSVYSIMEHTNHSYIKKGDVAWMNGHVGVIVYVNDIDNSIDIVHVSSSGGGTNLTAIDLNTGLIIRDDLGENMLQVDRLGKKYFTHFISVDY